MRDEAIATLPGPLRAWFRRRFGAATQAQRLAWPALARGDSLLLSAPTGTGKTLAAFLPILGELFLQPAALVEGPPLRCLYVSPLKALVNDACRSLEGHIADLAPLLSAPPPCLAVRTGDTPAAERRLLRTSPPDVLFTTPESLALLLSRGSLHAAFANLRWVVVDEAHALAGGKRGADLAVSLERLEELAPAPLQRVGLSATATPQEEAARFLVGPGRPCTVVRAGERAPPELTIEPLEPGRRFFSDLVERLLPALAAHRSTLIFANARGLTERLAWALRRRAPQWDGQIAVHHSALSAERRREVEGLFKAGALRAVVSSTSLELGIDVGSVDLAVLVHPPGDVVRLLQRVGRSGHGPHALRRGLVLTAGPAELLEATVTAASGLAGQCEPLRVPEAPLDVLCQQLVGILAADPRAPDELFALVRRAAPYAELSREDFDGCLAYLRGLDRDGESWLPARLAEDGDCLRVRDARTARLLRRNLGTILADENVPVRLRTGPEPADPFADEVEAQPPLTVGEVDEAFAGRLQPGDRFLLDGRCLETVRLEDGALLVEEVAGRPRVPRWGGEGLPLSPELANRLFLLRLRAAEALREGPGALAGLLGTEYGLQEPAAALLADYFQRQEAMSEIPDPLTLLIEAVGREGGCRLYLHTPLNRAGNDALARVAVARLAREHGLSATSVVADLGLALCLRSVPPDVPGLVRALLRAEGLDSELDRALADGPALRERFGRVALTGLMLLRQPLGGRRRVGGRGWGGRRLFDQVAERDGGFVLLRQARREVRAELCDGAAARAYAEALPGLAVRCRWLAVPSPFVEAWTQAETGAEAVESPAEALRRLHAQLTGGGEACGHSATGS
jgi:ATP-dependent Lhr-like helicase